jgi:hypothetical protein
MKETRDAFIASSIPVEEKLNVKADNYKNSSSYGDKYARIGADSLTHSAVMCTNGNSVNAGSDNTGDKNGSNYNGGDYNTSSLKTGYQTQDNDYNQNGDNDGNQNEGYDDAGYEGNDNTGDSNDGNNNTGRINTGDNNTGYNNYDDYNKGNNYTGNNNYVDCNNGDDDELENNKSILQKFYDDLALNELELQRIQSMDGREGIERIEYKNSRGTEDHSGDSKSIGERDKMKDERNYNSGDYNTSSLKCGYQTQDNDYNDNNDNAGDQNKGCDDAGNVSTAYITREPIQTNYNPEVNKSHEAISDTDERIASAYKEHRTGENGTAKNTNYEDDVVRWESYRDRGIHISYPVDNSKSNDHDISSKESSDKTTPKRPSDNISSSLHTEGSYSDDENHVEINSPYSKKTSEYHYENHHLKSATGYCLLVIYFLFSLIFFRMTFWLVYIDMM